MKYTNINILDNNRRFKYIIEYKDDIENISRENLSYSLTDNLRVDFFNSQDTKYIRVDNYWNKYLGDTTIDYIPESYNLSSVNLYFPTNSVESYTKNYIYALTINTWIHGHIVYLGTYIIDRRDAIACDKQKVFLNSRYYEYINIKFIDPYYITYSDDWKDFRQIVCGETELYDMEQNNTGSILNFTLYPVYYDNGQYNKLDPYIGGQNAINMADEVDDYINYNIHINTSQTTAEKIIYTDLNFNQEFYSGNVPTIEDLKNYMQETYSIKIDDIKIKYELVVIDNENIYKSITKIKNDIYCEFLRDELMFDSWDGWKEGLNFSASATIIINEEETLLLHSNVISITQDIMKYFIGKNPINTVNLTSLNMINYTINAVNKIEKKIIQLEKPTDYKTNLIRPVYFRTRELNNLIIHPAVTENICLNLDAYKSQVNVFYIQIENTVFVESARTNAGIIFKIVGANLKNDIGEGTFYILNQDKELITTGKYRYEQ